MATGVIEKLVKEIIRKGKVTTNQTRCAKCGLKVTPDSTNYFLMAYFRQPDMSSIDLLLCKKCYVGLTGDQYYEDRA